MFIFTTLAVIAGVAMQAPIILSCHLFKDRMPFVYLQMNHIGFNKTMLYILSRVKMVHHLNTKVKIVQATLLEPVMTQSLAHLLVTSLPMKGIFTLIRPNIAIIVNIIVRQSVNPSKLQTLQNYSWSRFLHLNRLATHIYAYIYHYLKC